MKKIRTKFIEAINKNESSGINLLILSFIASIIKQYCTYISYKNLNYGLNYYINSFFTDAIVVLIILGITILNQYIKNRIVKIFNNIICLIIFTVFCIDIFTIYFLQNRISIFQAFQYVNNGSNGFATPVIVILGIITVLRISSILLTKNIKSNSKKTKNALLTIFFIFGGLILIFSKPNEINNIITLNISFIKDILQYDNVYASGNENNTEVEEGTESEKIKNNYEDYIKYEYGEGKDINVILVFAESLSAIDSSNMGGNDNMPHFDMIQKEGITFTNFITNGTTSDTAHISTLLGVIPLRNMRVKNSTYTGYKLKMQALPEYLNSQGYNTTFISTADLSFLNQRDFLIGAGFQKIIGEENFAKNKKYTFDAAPDKDLYDKVIEEIVNQTGKFFIGLQTISFHKPYNTPNGKTEKSALQYSDQELYRFYKKLEKIGYFNSGILIIVGDHRKMNAAEDGERELFGKNRYTKSVATIIGTGIQPGTIENRVIQHTDFYNSIKKLIGHGLVEIDSNYNNIFTSETNRDRGITNSTLENGYIISQNGKTTLIKNISNIQQDNPIYKYFQSYIKYQFGNNKNNEDIPGNNTVKIIGHRGSTKNSTENTLQSFIDANKLSADGIELDVSYTKDHKNIVLHGENLSNSNCKKEKVGDQTYERIKENCEIENGESFRSLKEMLELIDGLFEYYIVEIKVHDETLGAEQTLDAIQTVKELNMLDKVIFISYSEIAKKVLSIYPNINFGRDTYDTNDLDIIGNNDSKYFLAPYEDLTPDIIKKAQEIGKEVIPYTVNDTENFQQLKDLGIKMIITDEIQLLKEYESTYNQQ